MGALRIGSGSGGIRSCSYVKEPKMNSIANVSGLGILKFRGSRLYPKTCSMHADL